MAATDDGAMRSATHPDIVVRYASQDSAGADSAVAALEGAGMSYSIAPRNVVPREFYAGQIAHANDHSRVTASAAGGRTSERQKSRVHSAADRFVRDDDSPARLSEYVTKGHPVRGCFRGL